MASGVLILVFLAGLYLLLGFAGVALLFLLIRQTRMEQHLRRLQERVDRLQTAAPSVPSSPSAAPSRVATPGTPPSRRPPAESPAAGRPPPPAPVAVAEQRRGGPGDVRQCRRLGLQGRAGRSAPARFVVTLAAPARTTFAVVGPVLALRRWPRRQERFHEAPVAVGATVGVVQLLATAGQSLSLALIGAQLLPVVFLLGGVMALSSASLTWFRAVAMGQDALPEGLIAFWAGLLALVDISTAAVQGELEGFEAPPPGMGWLKDLATRVGRHPHRWLGVEGIRRPSPG